MDILLPDTRLKSAFFKMDKDYEQTVLDKTSPNRKTRLKSC